MLLPEEEDFLIYWETNRADFSKPMSKLLRGLPMAIVFGVPILVSIAVVYFLFPDWYTKISKANAQTFIVISLAVILAIVFYAFTRMHFKWEMNEQLYLELKQKQKEAANHS